VNTSYYIGWHLWRLLFAVYFRWKVYDQERVPLEGSVILAANHTSYLDPPLVGVAVPRVINYLGRDTLFRFPGMPWLLRSWHVVPVDPTGGGSSGLKIILDRLHAGAAIVLFPEGTRSRDGNPQPPRSGIGLTVIKSTAPLIPVRIFGTFEAYGRHLILPRPKPIAVKYGKPMMFEALRAEAAVCGKPRLKEIYQQVASEVMAEIMKLEPKKD
jgi:1-acyl-sn-glycerol-3-phosphate acyltransferase